MAAAGNSDREDVDRSKERSPPMPRRRSLRAVFAADVAGFSGRMSLNETSTVNLLNEIRIIGRRALKTYDGWLFGMAGDGLFATFESAVNAVHCALLMQSELSDREDLKDMPLRIGIHLGEVLIDDDLPYGETLNIAARLEALADPGGILVSGTVMDAVSSRISATFEDRGVPVLKNIPRRIPTYAVKPPPARSPADETRIGQSNLDRTTRLDRSALRDLMQAHAQAAEASGAEKTAETELPPQSRDQTKPPATETLAQKLASLAKLDNISQPERHEGHARPPVSAGGRAKATEPLEKTLPDISALPPTEIAPSVRRPTPEFIGEIIKALAVHVGPFAKLIVERELKTGPTNFDLITQLEKHIPTEQERLTFRVRASHINAMQPSTASKP